MKTLTFKVTIKAPAKEIWEIITSKDTYEAWTKVAHPGSTFEGEWKQGAQIKFFGPEGGGTLVEFTELVPAKLVKSVHVAVLTTNGKEDKESDIAKSWIGTTEDYYFVEKDGMTELTIEMKTTPEWVEMFEDSWPKLLGKLKDMCES